MQANLAHTIPADDGNWYPDSGATNDCTPYLQNLMTNADYTGSDQIYVGNGIGLSIKHCGQTLIASNNHAKPLFLKNLLHVLEITKNLLSVSKFALDNNVLFEFHADACYVKHQVTKEILLTEIFHNGQYTFDPGHLKMLPPSHSSVTQDVHFSSPKSALVVTSDPVVSDSSSQICSHCTLSLVSDFDLWHKRLGHPSHKVVKSVLQSCNISCNKASTSVYQACCLGKIHKMPFPKFSNAMYSKSLQLIVSNLWGPSHNLSYNGLYISRYVIFDEFKFPYATIFRDTKPSQSEFSTSSVIPIAPINYTVESLFTTSSPPIATYVPGAPEINTSVCNGNRLWTLVCGGSNLRTGNSNFTWFAYAKFAGNGETRLCLKARAVIWIAYPRKSKIDRWKWCQGELLAIRLALRKGKERKLLKIIVQSDSLAVV
uniref:GAG-pre-integrase domain-containing protein n=1 Tax=Cannabis sativa TaxID=3483 RepID=A0A803QCQ5_CANSA